MERVAIIGYSGHAYVVLDACKESKAMIGYYCEPSERDRNPFHLQYLGDESNHGFDWSRVDAFVFGIGDNYLRAALFEKVESNQKRTISVLHPSSTISSLATFGTGIFLSSQAVLNPFVRVGKNCIINTGAVVEHECIIGNHVHLAPGAVLSGNVTIGDYTFIGANSVIKQGVTIGKNVVIGAGSVVLKDIPDHGIWAGNPAKSIKK